MSITLQDIKIQTIDFDWITTTTKISHLKRAIRLIEEDGNFYTELKDACYKRMEDIDPTLKRVKYDNHLTPELKENIQNQLQEWHHIITKKQVEKPKEQVNLEDYESYFNNDLNNQSEKKRMDLAEKQRVKGNEAIKSKDFDEAISYYNRSINLDNKMYQSYGNRALAYLKKKQFFKCIEDCQKALALNSTYIKALHRKAKALIGLKRKVQAYRCYKQILKLQPDNSQMNKQMKQLREQMSEDQIRDLQSSLIPKSQFKKITIEQDSDEEIHQA